MFQINDDLSINITRGDTAVFTVNALNESGENYLFQKGDVVRIKVTEKKACENVMFQKDFVVEEETEQVELLLTEDETKIGEVISKPTDYWYEVELNPFTNPQTIIGYDENGAKIFKLFPEGKDVESVEPTPEDIPVVDEELDLTSERPVQNQAIARAFLNIQNEIERIDNDTNITSEDLEPLKSDIDANKTNIAKNTGSIEDLTSNVEELNNHKANTANPHNVTAEQTHFDKNISGLNSDNVQGAIDELKGTIGYSKKNLLKFPYDANSGASVGDPYDINGIIWSVNNDGSVTANGTNTSDSNMVLWNRNTSPLKLKKGKYILSGCPKGGSTDTYSLLVLKTVGDTYEIIAQDVGEGVEFELTEDTNVGVLCKVWKSGVTISGTYYPMIRLASIQDDTYEPYVADVQTQLNTIFTGVDYVVQTTANNSASPYTRYGELDISSHINAYGTPICVCASNSSGIPVPCSFSTGSKKLKVCSNLGEIYVRIIYVKIPVTVK